MTTVPYFFSSKTATDVLDFSFDFKNLLAKNETITSAEVTASPSGLTVGSVTINKSIVTAWISAGQNDTSYSVSYHIVTNQGRTETRSAILNVQD